LRAAREYLRMTQRELADLLRLGPYGDRTVRRYENGESVIPGPVSVVIEMIFDERRLLLAP
jgi:DNA (cytosine-5)-methyltransferase 1